jgi:hypothetical protein
MVPACRRASGCFRSQWNLCPVTTPHSNLAYTTTLVAAVNRSRWWGWWYMCRSRRGCVHCQGSLVPVVMVANILKFSLVAW